MLRNDSNDKNPLKNPHEEFKQAFLLFLILNITFGICRAILAVLWTQVSGIQTD